MSGGMALPGGWTLARMWLRLPGETWAGAATAFLATWVVMMVAMMLPPLLPMLARYRRSVPTPVRLRRDGLTTLAAAGYFSAWTVCGVAAYVAGGACARAALRWSAVAHAVPLATGVVLVLAGGVQLTGWKARQLEWCRQCGPMGAPDAPSAYRYGLRHGVHCCLCCAGFMTLLLVTGMMRLGAVAAVSAAISVERLAATPQRAARFARAAGIIVLMAGVGAVARACTAETLGRMTPRDRPWLQPVLEPDANRPRGSWISQLTPLRTVAEPAATCRGSRPSSPIAPQPRDRYTSNRILRPEQGSRGAGERRQVASSTSRTLRARVVGEKGFCRKVSPGSSMPWCTTASSV